jgi:hypothetical protein
MRRVVLAVILTLAIPASAGAQSQILIGLSGPGRQISQTYMPASVSGELAVDFKPDPGTGCAVLAACGYRGSEVWTPGGGGALILLKYEQSGRIHTLADLSLGQGNQGPTSLGATSVQRVAGGSVQGSCGDEQSGVADVSGEARHGSIQLRLSSQLASVRCAGPLSGDLANVAPVLNIATRDLVRGHVSLDFRVRRSFALHGFAGTLTSTVVVRLGRPRVQRGSSPATFPPGVRTQRMRVVTEAVTVARSTGSLTAAVSGTRDLDVCVLLDSCGLAGTLTIAPKPTASEGELSAIGPASRPYADFLTALGLSDAGHPRGIQVSGGANWTDPGTLSTALTGSVACSDSAPLGQGMATLGVTKKGLTVGYLIGGASFPGGVSPRTRCPGPMVSQLTPLASGMAPRPDLRRRSFTVSLRSGHALSDQGYEISVRGALRLTFRRGRVRQQIVTFPAG